MSEYLRERKISELNENPINSTIYDENPKQLKELVDSIEKNGLLEPLVITENNMILSGHRRFNALKKIGMEYVECRIITDEIPNPTILLIEMNRHRRKSESEILREASVLEKEYSKLVKMGRPKKGEPKKEKYSTILKIAETLNMSQTKLKKLKSINSYDKELLKQVDMGILSVEKAYQQVRKKYIIPNANNERDAKSYDHKNFRSSMNRLLERYNPSVDVVMKLVNKRFGSVVFEKETRHSDEQPMKIIDKKDIKYLEVKKYNRTLLSRVDAGLISLTEAHNIIRSDMMNISEVKGKGTKSNKITFSQEFEIISKRYKPKIDDWIEEIKKQFPFTYKSKIKDK